MKYILITLFAFTLNAQTIWYIDRDATGGTYNGTSWSTAWRTFEAINWASIGTGDTVYVSGGADSTEYKPTANNSNASIIIGSQSTPYTFADGDPVVIMPAELAPVGSPVREAASWTDHNGDVVITNHTPSLVDEGTATSTEPGFVNDATQNFLTTVSVGDRIYNEVIKSTLVVTDVVSNTRLEVNSTAMHSGDTYKIYRNAASRLFEIYGVSNVKLYGLRFEDRLEIFGGFIFYVGGWEISTGYDSLITFENCHYIGKGHNQGMYITGHKTLLKDCIWENLSNDNNDPQDLFGIAGGSGELVFDGNLIICRSNSLTTTEHADGVQFSNFGSNSNNTVDVVMKNNIILHLGVSVAWTGLIYSSNPRVNCNFYIYNNIIGTNNPNATTCTIITNQPDTTDTWEQSTFIFNNTLITHGDATGLATPIVVSNDYPHRGIDTLIIKNNLIIMDAPVDQILNLQIDYGTCEYVREVDYNGYFEYGGISNYMTNGDGFGSYTYTDWIGLGYDAHSDTGNSVNVTFTDKLDTLATGYYTETGRDLGVDLSSEYPDLVAKFPDLVYDILGNPRTGTWDIGALEYQDGAVDTVPSFSFTALNNQEINTAYIGSATFSGADSTFSVWTTTGARFNINSSSSLSTTLKTAVSSDVVYVETVTGSSYSTGYNETIVAGGVSRDFTVTTKTEPIPQGGSGRVLRDSTGKVIRDSTGKVIKK